MLGSDAHRTQSFYTELFGWKLQDSSFPGYAMTEDGTSGAAGGGIGSSGDGPNWTTLYAKVEDVEKSLAKADELGGGRVYGPNDVMDGILTRAFRDPAGNVFGVYSGTRS